jgi:hypothetical protein
MDGDADVARDALRWDDPGAGADTVVAGSTGTRLLVLHFPDPPTSERAALS